VQPSDRYTGTAIALHWLIAVLVVAEFAWGWWMQSIPKQPPGFRADAFNLHKSVGLAILLLMVARLAWRLAHRPPALPPMPAWNARLAHANHALMYAALFALTVGGYLGSAWSGYPVLFFGQPLPAWAGHHPLLKEAASGVHLAASWVIGVAFALHVGGTAKHALVDRNGTLARMWPARRRRSPRAASAPATGAARGPSRSG
jgi:cytochrome b561